MYIRGQWTVGILKLHWKKSDILKKKSKICYCRYLKMLQICYFKNERCQRGLVEFSTHFVTDRIPFITVIFLTRGSKDRLSTDGCWVCAEGASYHLIAVSGTSHIFLCLLNKVKQESELRNSKNWLVEILVLIISDIIRLFYPNIYALPPDILLPWDRKFQFVQPGRKEQEGLGAASATYFLRDLIRPVAYIEMNQLVVWKHLKTMTKTASKSINSPQR